MITRTTFWRAALSALAVATFALAFAGCDGDEPVEPKKPAAEGSTPKKADHPKGEAPKKADHPKGETPEKAEGSEKKADHPQK